MKPMNRVRNLVISVALGVASTTAGATDLLQSYELARGNDMLYATALSRRAAAQEKLPQAQALLRPSVEFSANVARNHSDTQYRGTSPFPGGSSQFNSNSYGISLRQPLYRKQEWLQLDQAELQRVQADAQLADDEQRLILRVTQAYFDVLAAQDDLTFVQAQKTAIAEQLAQAKGQFEVGTLTVTDANEAQARFDLANAQEIAAHSGLRIKKRALRKILGTESTPLVPLADGWQMTPPQPDDIERWEARASESNPAVLIQTAALEIASQEIKRQRAGHHPTIDLVANYQEDAASGSASVGTGSDSTTAMIGVQLRLPLYAGGGTSSRVREARYNIDTAKEQLENARRTTALDANQAFLGVTDGLTQVLALEQAVISSEGSLASSRLGWEVGVRTSIDVLNAQQQLYGAHRDLAKARYATILNLLQLHATTGQLDQTVLAEINRWLH